MRYPMSRELFLHRIFALGIWLKGIDGVLEIAGAGLLLVLSPTMLNQFVITLTQHELVEDPHDLIATALRRFTAQISPNTQLFASLYLIAHGLIKVALVAGLWRGKQWAYPTAIGFLCLFILYQLYRLSYHTSMGLLLLTLFDVLMVGLTWHEYRRSLAIERRARNAQSNNQ
jgi:uncharacterized membrane protein